jgi:excisionase family DNA binding protein
MDSNIISISEAANMLGVSVDTLRRWDKSGKFISIQTKGGHRRYYKFQIELFLNDLYKIAKGWVLNEVKLDSEYYCSNSAIFQARLMRMQEQLGRVEKLISIAPLIVAITGEIGNNSFDHNLGNWPDVPGIFFGYDINKKIIVLADRGLGILTTLKRVKPELKTDLEALKTAFTEVISGRAPENRGNGLKFVRKIVSRNLISLFFQTGKAELMLKKDDSVLDIKESLESFRGCLALIKF